MNKRSLGKTGLKVSEIGLGCRNLGGQCIINGYPTTYGDIDETTALTIIKKAIELGVNVFDTADIYSLGNSEKRLGRAIKEKRDEVLIFTKGGGIPIFDTKKTYEIDISFNHLIDALHRSLKRLETDFVDLFQVHSAPKSEDDFKNFEKTFKEMKNSNLTRFCGVSIGPYYKSGIELIKRGIVDTLQIYFSLLDYEPIDELLPLAKKEGVGIIIAKPLSQGFLAGKYQSNHIFPKNDLRSSLSRKEIDIRIDRTNLFKFLENDSRSLSQSALSYVLKREEVSTCIPTSNSIEQLKSNIEVADISITEDELMQIIKIQESFKMDSDNFDETYYLAENPDVDFAVSKGHFKSGKEHYIKFGYKENRKICPLKDMPANKDNLKDFIKTKYDLINWFAKEYNFSSYLEISTLTTGHFFEKVDSNFFKIKDCINYYVEEHEPFYSEFGNAVLKDHDFKILPFDYHLNKIIDKNQKYDVIFVDPFHTVEHTIRDLEAALSLLSSTGIIIVHDCFPNSEALIGPWKGRGGWCGQTYEGYIRFLLKNSHFENFVINIDYGCGIIRPHYKSTIKRDFVVDTDKLSSWEYYWNHHNQLLNLKSIDKLYELYRHKESF